MLSRKVRKKLPSTEHAGKQRNKQPTESFVTVSVRYETRVRRPWVHDVKILDRNEWLPQGRRCSNADPLVKNIEYCCIISRLWCLAAFQNMEKNEQLKIWHHKYINLHGWTKGGNFGQRRRFKIYSHLTLKVHTCVVNWLIAHFQHVHQLE